MVELRKIKNARLPRLDTLIMIESLSKKKEWKSRRELWMHLPRKVMWQTFILAMDYIENRNNIVEKEENKKVEEKVHEIIANIPSYVY